MTTKYISSYIAGGYTLSASYAYLTITSTGGIGGTGLLATANVTVSNDGFIDAASGSTGVILVGGGALINGSSTDTAAFITGVAGVDSAAYAEIINWGTIQAVGAAAGNGVNILGGGVVSNGGYHDTSALITGLEGVYISGGLGTVENFGVIRAEGSSSLGVDLEGGGHVINEDPAARIEGEVLLRAAGTVINDGAMTIGAAGNGNAVYIGGGGQVTNGAPAAATALIMSGQTAIYIVGGAGTVGNYGTIESTQPSAGDGVFLQRGGRVTNGTALDHAALIEGANGLVSFYSSKIHVGAAATLNNFGVVEGFGLAGYDAVSFGDGGRVVNGSAGDTIALIEGYGGVSMARSGESVVNYGTIEGVGTVGVQLSAAGSVVNGTGGDTKAIISGANGGLSLLGGGMIVNFDTVEGGGGAGISIAGGSVTNGSGSDRLALVTGDNGVIASGLASVANGGVLEATGAGGAYGLALLAGGSLVNGSKANGAALIEGYGGAELVGAVTATNFGTIQGQGDTGGAGVAISGGGPVRLVNGAAGHTGALISGYFGVDEVTNAKATIINYGTIQGLVGAAVRLAGAGDTLAVEAGSTFLGQVFGGGGTLDLASGAPVLAGLFGGGDVTVSGSMASTNFQGFGTLEVGAGTSATLSGAGIFAAGQTLIDDGALVVASTLTSAGAFTLAGKLSGAGTLAVTGGTLALDAGADPFLAAITISGASTKVSVATNVFYGGPWNETGGTLAVAKGDSLTLGGPVDGFAGTMNGAGTVIVAGKLTMGASGATLTGGGVLEMSVIVIVGASGSTTLTNVNDTILGAGQLGDGALALVNEAGGVIDGNGDVFALVINTGAATIANAGDIEATAAGGTQILSAIANTGLLIAQGGTLTVSGPVTGSGSAHIGAGGTADFTSTFGQNVTFTATSGVLELAKSQSYSGQVTGFSKSGSTSFDLRDITFGGPTKATYSGTAASGTLTVTDGVHTAHITLIGNYLSSLFKVSSDGGPGTKVIDPTGPGVGILPPTPLAPFVAAAASFGASGASLTIAHDSWRPPPPSLSNPRAQIA